MREYGNTGPSLQTNVGPNWQWPQTPTALVMSREVRRVASSSTVEEGLRLMVVHGHRHLLVEEDGKVRGLVSIRDLMSWIVLPENPIAHEGRVGVIRARTSDAIRAFRSGGTGND